MNLALVDRNAEGLSQAQEHFAKDAAVTKTYSIDVSQLSEWRSLRSKVQSDFGHLDLVMLNAAIGLQGSWEEAEYFEQVVSIFSELRSAGIEHHR